jgi:cardiolipin synthase
METKAEREFTWLKTGEKAIAEMLPVIQSARKTIRLELYIFASDTTGESIRGALVDAAKRGVRVQVMVDALGSIYLSDSFWKPLRAAGGEMRWFNPLRSNRPSFRDHRKLLVCDERAAIIGGFNVADVYQGDGVSRGWRDLGLKINGELAGALADAFDQMFVCAEFRHKPFARLRKSRRQKTLYRSEGQLLLSGPSRNNPIRRALHIDMRHARDVALVSAYFLPPWKVRRDLIRLARRGARVRLVLPGKSDVKMSQLAGQSFYRRLLTAGIEIYEYQPQILHAKLFLLDDIAYVGSSNLDARSLTLNYELMVRIPNAALAAEGRAIFEELVGHCRRISLSEWQGQRSFWERLKARLAHFILARLDLVVAKWQLRD